MDAPDSNLKPEGSTELLQAKQKESALFVSQSIYINPCFNLPITDCNTINNFDRISAKNKVKDGNNTLKKIINKYCISKRHTVSTTDGVGVLYLGWVNRRNLGM